MKDVLSTSDKSWNDFNTLPVKKSGSLDAHWPAHICAAIIESVNLPKKISKLYSVDNGGNHGIYFLYVKYFRQHKMKNAETDVHQIYF